MNDSDHIVIAGGGRVGHRVAQRFRDRGCTATVIDPDPDTAERVGGDGIEYLRGDATKPAVLRAAITDRTTVVGALTDRTDTNLVVCMAAKRLSSDLRTVARIDDESGDEYSEYLDEVYFPERASVRAAVNALTGSDIRIDYEAPAAGEVVAESLPEGSVVIAATDGNVAVQHSTKLVAGRRYLIAADQDVVNEVIRQCRGESAT